MRPLRLKQSTACIVQQLYCLLHTVHVVSKCYASWCNLYKRFELHSLKVTTGEKYICISIYMAIWSQRIAATLVACVAETSR